MKALSYKINSFLNSLIFCLLIIQIRAETTKHEIKIIPQLSLNSINNKRTYFKKNISLEKMNKEKEFSYYNNSSNKMRFLADSISDSYTTVKESLDSFTASSDDITEISDKYSFHLTTTSNEISKIKGEIPNNNNFVMIDLENCLKTLKSENTNLNDPFIILKFENKTDSIYEKNIQFEVYHPSSLDVKQDLSKCKNNNFILYFQFDLEDLEEEQKKLYIDLKKNGYDLLNQNDPFYQDICTQYKSKDNSDVLLGDRRNLFFIKDLAPQSNCQYLGYSSEKKLLSFKCEIKDKNIDTEHITKYSGKDNLSNFEKQLKNLNLKVLKCHKSVLSSKAINVGTIISTILIVVNLCFAIVFIVKEISPLRLQFAKFFFQNPKKNHKHENNIENNTHVNYPPRKARAKTHIGKKVGFKTKDEDEKHSDFKKSQNEPNVEKEKEKKGEIEKEEKEINVENLDNLNQYIKHRHKRKRKTTKKHSSKTTNNFTRKDKKSKTMASTRNGIIETTKNEFSDKKNDELTKGPDKESKLDDYELNHLAFNEALNIDQRSFCQMYLSIIKREHIIKFTFFNWNDYNLFYIKFIRFFFLLLTCISMNIFFFFDDSIHDIFVKKGKFDFVKLIPQIIYSTIVIHASEVIVCFFTMTDKYIYQIKKNGHNEINKIELSKILKCIKIKLNIFFIYIFILKVFYWYLITSFCVVYKNTQIILLLNSLFSFILYLIYPFILYALTTIFRYLGIKKSSSCLYSLGNIIPIF